MKHATPSLFRAGVLAAGLLLALGAAPAHAADTLDAILAHARAFLGGDEKLDAVTSLRFKGTVTAPNGTSHPIEIFARKPMQQLIVEHVGEGLVVTGLDDYDGWRKEGPAARPEAGRIMFLGAPEVRRLRASTWQVLYYYQNIGAVGGTITLEGEEEIDGVRCARVNFTHTGAVVFIRFFDLATGRLVLTRTDDGTELRESGEIMVNGIRFPRNLNTVAGDQTSQVTFEEIAVNETFPPKQFRLPMPKVDFGPTAAPAPEPESEAPTLPSIPQGLEIEPAPGSTPTPAP